MLKFITLLSPAIYVRHANGGKFEQSEHTSSLAIDDKYPDTLRCVGVIPHCAQFRPATAADRDALVSFLQSLPYEDEPRPRYWDLFDANEIGLHIERIDDEAPDEYSDDDALRDCIQAAARGDAYALRCLAAMNAQNVDLVRPDIDDEAAQS